MTPSQRRGYSRRRMFKIAPEILSLMRENVGFLSINCVANDIEVPWTTVERVLRTGKCGKQVMAKLKAWRKRVT